LKKVEKIFLIYHLVEGLRKKVGWAFRRGKKEISKI
jgi:hypothetical protein